MDVLRLLAVASLTLLVAVTGLPAQQAQADGHPTGACVTNYVSHAGWDLCWQRDDPRAQGLELSQVYFKGQSVLWRIGIPFSMTKYEANAYGPYKDTLGNPGAGGHPGYGAGAMTLSGAVCPRFYTTGTLIDSNKICVETRDGPEPALAIWSKYNIYNYRFMQGYKMDARGVLEPFVRLGGLLIDGNGGATAPDRPRTNPADPSTSIGRNAGELVRKLKAAKFVRDNGGVQVCPASWEPGDSTLKPGMDLVGKI